MKAKPGDSLLLSTVLALQGESTDGVVAHRPAAQLAALASGQLKIEGGKPVAYARLVAGPNYKRANNEPTDDAVLRELRAARADDDDDDDPGEPEAMKRCSDCKTLNFESRSKCRKCGSRSFEPVDVVDEEDAEEDARHARLLRDPFGGDKAAEARAVAGVLERAMQRPDAVAVRLAPGQTGLTIEVSHLPPNARAEIRRAVDALPRRST